jgi:hypothetical protein
MSRAQQSASRSSAARDEELPGHQAPRERLEAVPHGELINQELEQLDITLDEGIEHLDDVLERLPKLPSTIGRSRSTAC